MLTARCRFLPNSGKYICNVLFDRSNGEEKDKSWGWKKDGKAEWEGVHPKGAPSRELEDLRGGEGGGERARL